MRHSAAPLALAAGLAMLAAPAATQEARMVGTQAASIVPRAEIEAIRRSTEKYGDVKVALAEGYVPDPTGMCMTAEAEGGPRQLGGMGIHYFRPDLLGMSATEPRVNGNGTHTDFTRPAVLLYEPQQDGALRLVGIENLVWADAWRKAGNTAPPEFHGQQYYYRHDNPATELDEAHGFEPHYELHFWLYRDNPSGAFMQFNPAVTCPPGKAAHAH